MKASRIEYNNIVCLDGNVLIESLELIHLIKSLALIPTRAVYSLGCASRSNCHGRAQSIQRGLQIYTSKQMILLFFIKNIITTSAFTTITPTIQMTQMFTIYNAPQAMYRYIDNDTRPT